MKGKKQKLCTIGERLLEEGFFADAKEAGTWIMMKKVLVNDQPVWSLHEKVPADGMIRIKEFYKKQYVNKGGFKLEAALDRFPIRVEGAVALDCGASTGGFTDCWLQHGARLVYAVDAGFGQLAGKLATDSRVVNMERTNLADDRLKALDPKPELISLDLSYLSLKKALPICMEILRGRGTMICLIKPIYEVESSEIRRTGNINQRPVLKEILMDLCRFYRENGLDLLGLTNSPVRGNSGTLEYLAAVGIGDGFAPDGGREPGAAPDGGHKLETETDGARGRDTETDGGQRRQTELSDINERYEEEIEKALDSSFALGEFRK